jgi:hypothetical protein
MSSPKTYPKCYGKLTQLVAILSSSFGFTGNSFHASMSTFLHVSRIYRHVRLLFYKQLGTHSAIVVWAQVGEME